MAELDAAPGLYGKVSSHGDFVSRRLPPGFVALWDGWLQACMQGSREQLGAAWLNCYLNGPIWRFALAPGVCDKRAWAGVLMPSVDRVGRHFPLTLVAGSPGSLPLQAWMVDGAPWYDQLEAMALSSLDAHFQFEQLDAQLLAMAGLPGGPGQGAPSPAGCKIALDGLGQLGDAIPALTGAALYGQSLWWTEGSAQVAPCVLLCRGLPGAAGFAAMLAGP